MNPAQIAKIMELVDDYRRVSISLKYTPAEEAELRAAIEAALRDAPQHAEWWKEAAIAWTVCASIHEQWAKGKDALFKTRQDDFLRRADDARAYLAARPSAPAAVEPTAEEVSVVEPRDERAVLSEMIDSYALAFHAAIVRPESHDKMKAKAESIMDAILARASKGTPL